MASNFPGSDDVFTEPSSPGSTALSSAGTGSRNHTQHHRDLGDSIEAMQAEATLLVHSHDGSTARHGSKLAQANTHQTPDTDSATSALHHTLGTGANQSAAGNHTHIQTQSHNSPDTDTGTSSLHHTIGTGANQAAAGNHVHAHPILVYFTSSGSFTKATYPGLYAVEIEMVGGGGGSGGCAATSGSQYSWGMGGTGSSYVRTLILAASLSSSETVTVGAGGAAGATGNNQGGNGGNSSFGSFCTAGGGEKGGSQSATTGGVGYGQNFGGVPSGTYDIGIKGEGLASINFPVGGPFSTNGGLDGMRAGGPWGCRNISQFVIDGGFSSGTGTAGPNYGNGASGPWNFPSTSARAGSVGAPGLVVVRLIF